MHPIPRVDVSRLERYLAELESSRPKLHHLIELAKLVNLMNKVGFVGPNGKSGSIVGFSHELLLSNERLTEGQFTVHIVHGGKQHQVHYRDLKTYVLPYVEEVIVELQQQHLIIEDDPNV